MCSEESVMRTCPVQSSRTSLPLMNADRGSRLDIFARLRPSADSPFGVFTPTVRNAGVQKTRRVRNQPRRSPETEKRIVCVETLGRSAQKKTLFIGRSMLAAFLDMTMNEAAQALDISPSTLQDVLHTFQLVWPHWFLNRSLHQWYLKIWDFHVLTYR